jgi:hypothetical protein
MHGSIVNMAMSRSGIKPEVGMGATKLLYSDRHACTIVQVIDDDTVMVQEDQAHRTDTRGMSEAQEYEYTPDPTAQFEPFSRRKNGVWVRIGESMKQGTKLCIGVRQAYRDFSF